MIVHKPIRRFVQRFLSNIRRTSRASSAKFCEGVIKQQPTLTRKHTLFSLELYLNRSDAERLEPRALLYVSPPWDQIWSVRPEYDVFIVTSEVGHVRDIPSICIFHFDRQLTLALVLE